MAQNRILDKIRQEIIESGRDTRYKLDAYGFVLSGLEFFFLQLGEKRHVTGQELSRALLLLARKQFGPLARNVLRRWGIAATDDFGNIVYNMIAIHVMSKQPEDRLEDFSKVEDFDDYFSKQEDFEIDREFIRDITGA